MVYNMAAAGPARFRASSPPCTAICGMATTCLDAVLGCSADVFATPDVPGITGKLLDTCPLVVDVVAA